MSVENLLGIPQRQVWYGALGIQKLIGYPSKGGEKRNLELRINVRREFIAYPSKAGLVGALRIKKLIGHPPKGGEKTSLELRINVRRKFTWYPLKAGTLWGSLFTKASRVSLKGW
jgi:hypothetical protein